jgi:GNAT superfamily N-acetyltransferase
MNVVIRRAKPEDAGALATVKLASWRATYAAFVEKSVLDNLSFETNEARFWEFAQRDDLGVFAAEDDAMGIVGYTVVGPSQVEDPLEVGEIQSIYILANAQGAGVGTQLMWHGARWLRVRGFVSANVWAFKKNERAIRFYSSLGAQLLRTSILTIEGVDYDDHCFQWPTVDELLENLKSRIPHQNA